MKKCKHCGMKIPNDSLFCPKCGKSVNSDLSLDDYAANDPYHSTSEETKEKEEEVDNSSYVEEQKENTPKNKEETSLSTYSNTFSILSLVFGALGGWLGLLFGILVLTSSKVEKERKRAKIGIGLFFAWFVVSFVLMVVALMNLLGGGTSL